MVDHLRKQAYGGIRNMPHKFHEIIAKALDINVAPGRFVWDAACGGSQWVSLFREPAKSRSNRFACADGALILDSSVRIVLEIEEAGTNGFLPARIAGKLTSSALCRYFIAGGQTQAVPFGEHVTFLQVINSAGLQPGSRKLDQYVNLHRAIQGLMPLGSITEYRLIAGAADDFKSGNAGDELRRAVKSVVSTLRHLRFESHSSSA